MIAGFFHFVESSNYSPILKKVVSKLVSQKSQKFTHQFWLNSLTVNLSI
jgi:hypothetical protein